MPEDKMPGIPVEHRMEEQRKKVMLCLADYLRESREIEKEPRRPQNKDNWRVFYGDIDWGKVPEGHQRIHIPRTTIAAEQLRAQIKAKLANFDRWLGVEYVQGVRESRPDMVMTEFAARNLIELYYRRNNFLTALSDAILHGVMECRSTLRFAWDKKKGLIFRVLGFENYHEDVEGDELYCCEQFEQRKHQVMALASEKPTKKKPYRLEAVKKLDAWAPIQDDDNAQQDAEGQQAKMQRAARRKTIRLHNWYCTVLDLETGEVMEWERADGSKFKLENVLITVANEECIIRDPEPIDIPDKEVPFASTLILRSPGPANKALMDPATDLNLAESSLFSMAATGAFKSVHQVNSIRDDFVKNRKVLDGGLRDGTTIRVSKSAPVNMKIFETIRTGEFPADAQAMLGVLQRLLPEAVFSNQLSGFGSIPSKEVRATEAVIADRTSGGIFEALAGDIEDVFIEKAARISFLLILQHSNEIPEAEVRAAFGDDQQRAQQWLDMSVAERLKDANEAFLFHGRGVRRIASNAAEAQALNNLLSLAASNPLMLEHVQQDVDFGKAWLELAEGLNVDREKIELSPEKKEQQRKIQQIREATAGFAAALKDGAQGQGGGAGNPSKGSAPAEGSGVPGSGQGVV